MKLLLEHDYGQRLDAFEDGCTPMHCGMQVVISDVLATITNTRTDSGNAKTHLTSNVFTYTHDGLQMPLLFL